jgi:hypothetical protein
VATYSQLGVRLTTGQPQPKNEGAIDHHLKLDENAGHRREVSTTSVRGH